jgi:beta-glucanase (GH16 family)
MIPKKISLILRYVTLMAICSFLLVGGTKAQDWGNPIWSDEFNSDVSGTLPNPKTWTFEAGAGGWGNHELEFYCPPGQPPTSPAPNGCDVQHPNAFQDGQGHLIVRAVRVSTEPAPTGSWTSARLKTAGLKDFQYGRIESCIKLPVGAGLWPAFWMLGSQGKWPAGGEMDIMENVPSTGGAGEGLGPTKSESTIHGPSSAEKGLFSLAKIFPLPDGQRIDDSTCHVYGEIWSPNMVQMYVDDWRKPFFIRTAADVPAGGRWVFNARFFFILNLAVGGDWPGPPDRSTPSPADMMVDYVRVYQAARREGPKMTAAPIKMEDSTPASAALYLTSTRGSGQVYLSCAPDSADVGCSVESGNALNNSVVDFSASEAQTAKIVLKRAHESSAGREARKALKVTVTAYTVSGEQSSLVIPIEN